MPFHCSTNLYIIRTTDLLAGRDNHFQEFLYHGSMARRISRRNGLGCKWSVRLRLLPSSFTLLHSILPTSSFAQDPLSGDARTSVFPTSLSVPTNIIDSTLSTSRSVISRYTATTGASSTFSSRSSSHTVLQNPASSDNTTTSSDNERNSSVLNWYFVFLVALAFFLFGGFWIVHRRKKRIKAYYRSTGQHALARDLDGWGNGRRWTYGNWRSGGSGGPRGGIGVRRQEGLNELGEAPPPYDPRPRTPPPPQVESEGSERAGRDTLGLAVPLATLSRDSRATLKPPDYDETIMTRTSSAGSSDGAEQRDHHVLRPAIAARPHSTQTSRPPTAALSTAESQRGMLPLSAGDNNTRDAP